MSRIANKSSRRYKLMSLPVGGVMVFPLAISSSVRAQLTEIRRTTSIEFTSELTLKQIRVTCVSRPETKTN